MRRGYRDRWEYDNSPQGDGLVTVSTLDKKTNYLSVEHLQERNARPTIQKRLREMGFIK